MSETQNTQKNMIEKKVSFSDDIEIHTMIYWSFAYQSARKGKWEECARDRERFKRRINSSNAILMPVLKKQIFLISKSFSFPSRFSPRSLTTSSESITSNPPRSSKTIIPSIS